MYANRIEWWESTIRSVTHTSDCDVHGHDIPELSAGIAPRPCNCDRDVRIAKGIKAALEAVYGHTFYGITDPSYPNEVYDAAAITAFEEASR